jgi:type I restriction enzyme M protein
VPGLCKVATLAEIEAQGWSLTPGRYVGVEELEVLNAEARIAKNVAELLGGS